MKRLLSKEQERKITNSIIDLLTKEQCTLANYEKIHKLVIKHYKNNAILTEAIVEELRRNKNEWNTNFWFS